MTHTRSLAVAVFGVLCAIAASMAVGDQFAIFGIDRGVGAVGTFRAPTGRPVDTGSPATVATPPSLPAPALPAASSISSPSLMQPSPTTPASRGRGPATVIPRHRPDD